MAGTVCACIPGMVISDIEKDGRLYMLASGWLLTEAGVEWGGFVVDEPVRQLERIATLDDGSKVADVYVDRPVRVRLGHGEGTRFERLRPEAVAAMRNGGRADILLD